jgi:hypothetical protein
MWQWDNDLRILGFRRKGERFWLCERRIGLADGDHLSIFSWSEQAIPAGRAPRFLVELTEFHVTLVRAGENLHFYYHEYLENDWHPEGHTSRTEIRRLGLDPQALLAEADAVAAELVAALGGVLHGRAEARPSGG